MSIKQGKSGYNRDGRLKASPDGPGTTQKKIMKKRGRGGKKRSFAKA